MDYPDFFFGQNSDIVFGNPYAMRRQRAAIEHTQAIQQGNRRFSIDAFAFFHFISGFRQMDMDFRPDPPGDGNNFFHAARRAGIRGMRPQHHGNPTFSRTMEVVEQLFVFSESFLLTRTIDRNETTGQRRPHAGLDAGLRHLIHKKIHIGKSGCAGSQHFGDGQLRSPIYVFGGQVGFRRPDLLLQPVHQGHVVGIAAE